MKNVIIALLCLSVNIGPVKAQDKRLNNTNKQELPEPAAITSQPTTPASADPQQPDPNAGKFKFEEETHDFGEVMEGPLAECDFEFRNTGKSPIIITEAHGSCGCTVPKWPQEPILPKRKAVIHVTYNTSGRVGPINKDVFITSNAQQNPMKLHITGMVKAKPDDAAKPGVPLPPPTETPVR